MQIGLGQRFINTRRIGTERAAALEQQRDLFERRARLRISPFLPASAYEIATVPPDAPQLTVSRTNHIFFTAAELPFRLNRRCFLTAVGPASGA
jgi:hypothetical protein